MPDPGYEELAAKVGRLAAKWYSQGTHPGQDGSEAGQMLVQHATELLELLRPPPPAPVFQRTWRPDETRRLAAVPRQCETCTRPVPPSGTAGHCCNHCGRGWGHTRWCDKRNEGRADAPER